MRSFVSALIAATFATFASAAPISSPVNLPANLPSVPPVGDLPPTLPNIDSVEGEVESVTGAVRVRDILSGVTDTVDTVESDIHARGATPSVAVIFAGVLTEIQPYTQQLTYLDSSNCTVAEITNIVTSIKAPIAAAIPQLKALSGQNSSIILASADATVGVELTVSQVADIVGGEVKLVLDAVGQVLSVVKSQGGDILADVEDVFEDLGNTVAEAVSTVEGLVDGLVTSLAAVLAPVVAIISELGLTSLAACIGLQL